MSYNALAHGSVIAVNTGQIALLRCGERDVPSAIAKRPVAGPVFVGTAGLCDDEQADREHHGGPDKAVCAYPCEHYSLWSTRLGRPFGPGAFGENLTLEGLVESSVCVGDVLQVGDGVLLQVSQPRRPCFKLTARYGVPRLAWWVQQLGLTGFYLRVLRPGWLSAGMGVVVVERPNPEVTVVAVNRVLYAGTCDVATLDRVLEADGLSARLRSKLVARRAGWVESDRARLFGV